MRSSSIPSSRIAQGLRQFLCLELSRLLLAGLESPALLDDLLDLACGPEVPSA